MQVRLLGVRWRVFSTLFPAIALCLGLARLGMQTATGVTFEIDDTNGFAQIINTNSALTTNFTVTGTSGYYQVVEGPVWIPSGNFLVFSDLLSNKLHKLIPPNTVSDFYAPTTTVLCNGNMLDAQERLISCESGSAGLQLVMITNGTVTPLVNRCNNLKFYSPNDVIVKSDGTIWFTDPGYNSGIGAPPQSGFEGGYYVYCFNPASGVLASNNANCTPVVTGGVVRPNGLCFSPDESLLYLADSDTSQHHILVYNVSSSNTLSGARVFATIANGFPDGIRCDVAGRVWSSSGEGVYIYAPDGHLIGKIKYGLVSNLCFGGTNYHTLYMAGWPMLTSIPVLVTGMPSVKTLQSTVTGGQMTVSWPAPSSGFELQETQAMGPNAVWTNSGFKPSVSNAQNVVTVPFTDSADYFRLELN